MKTVSTTVPCAVMSLVKTKEQLMKKLHDTHDELRQARREADYYKGQSETAHENWEDKKDSSLFNTVRSRFDEWERAEELLGESINKVIYLTAGVEELEAEISQLNKRIFSSMEDTTIRSENTLEELVNELKRLKTEMSIYGWDDIFHAENAAMEKQDSVNDAIKKLQFAKLEGEEVSMDLDAWISAGDALIFEREQVNKTLNESMKLDYVRILQEEAMDSLLDIASSMLSEVKTVVRVHGKKITVRVH